MTEKVCFCAAVLMTLVLTAHAAKKSDSGSYVRGIVVEVQRHKVHSPDVMAGGSNPSDAPLTSRYYAYEVSVRIDCQTYVVRYETPFNYLPSEFTSDQPIQVRLTKHVMYFDLPYDPDLKMGIVRHKRVCNANR